MKRLLPILVLILVSCPLFSLEPVRIDAGIGIDSEASLAYSKEDIELVLSLKTDALACTISYPFTVGASVELRYDIVNTENNVLGLGIGASADWIVESNILFSLDAVFSYRHRINEDGGIMVKTGLALAGFSHDGPIIVMRDPVYSLQDMIIRHTAIGWFFML